MRNALLIARRELGTYFSSPIAYVVTAAFLVFTGLLYIDSLSGPFREASLRGWLAGETLGGVLGESINGAFTLLLLGPVLTMRLLAEEAKLGTLELLLTSPIRDFEVVTGKFISSMAILGLLLLLTLFYPLLLIVFGNPDIGPMLSGYLGLVLLGAFFLSVGLFASSLSSSQIASAVVGLVILLMFWFIDEAADFFRGLPESILEFVSPRTHFTDFARGIIDSESIIYYLALTAIFLFLAVRSLEARRWR
jgi:ABC-2 type transport system permease protein